MRRRSVFILPAALSACLSPSSAPTTVSTCNLCGTRARFQKVGGRKNAACPRCQSKERHRLLMHYLVNETQVLSSRLDVLHFSPDQALEDMFRTFENLEYKTADYLRTDEDLRLDLTALDQPGESWDVLIAYHVLEHIPDDAAAMREMFRVLRRGGRAFVQVPLEQGQDENYEDATITTDAGRSMAFGQRDHVRKYGRRGLARRLEAAGFRVEVVDYLGVLEAGTIEKHRLSAGFEPPQDESIWVVHKPLGADA